MAIAKKPKRDHSAAKDIMGDAAAEKFIERSCSEGQSPRPMITVLRTIMCRRNTIVQLLLEKTH
jgi:hypothetical protein